MSKALCCYSFETIYHRLFPETSRISLSKYFSALNESPSSLPSSAPLFITWDQDDRLRGCIGTFQSLPIESGVSKFAITSAFQDHRFTPISKHELNSALKVSVTLLDNFVDIHEWDNWTVGLHGLRISFEYDNEYYSGTFLPSVAEEQKWDKTDTLYNLLRKADFGYVKQDKVTSFYKKGLKEGWMTLTRYDGLKDELEYDEYIEIRKKILE
ncbi:AMMECR1 domain-containing protein [Scheffersomyces xylosifermentans]|uniref:AMMECR1 domain-containing protein n=1 Tax=Scheffersomyces xylosifermentans TaxID=1304137 RepID=UPI00315C9944